jgi:hypothetical protein
MEEYRGVYIAEDMMEDVWYTGDVMEDVRYAEELAEDVGDVVDPY